jgi:hypothetical protein
MAETGKLATHTLPAEASVWLFVSGQTPDPLNEYSILVVSQFE